MPATVKGIVAPSNHQPVEFREQESGQVVTTTPIQTAPSASICRKAAMMFGKAQFIPALRSYPVAYDSIDLRPEHFLDFKVSFQDFGQNEILVRVSAEGAGPHVFSIRSDNLAVREQATLKVDLTAGKVQQAVWHAHVLSADTPWVAVVIPDDVLAQRREVTGSGNASLSERNPLYPSEVRYHFEAPDCGKISADETIWPIHSSCAS